MTLYIALITLINLSLWLLLFLRLRKKFAPSVILREIRLEVEKLIIEINKEVDQDISLIEARRSGLKELLEKIDERILIIDKKIGLIDQENALLEKEEKVLEALNPQRAYTKHRSQNSKHSLSESSLSEPSLFTSHEDNTEQPIQISFSKNPINQAKATRDYVVSLALQGKDVNEIADSLKMPVREVSLILELHGN